MSLCPYMFGAMLSSLSASSSPYDSTKYDGIFKASNCTDCDISDQTEFGCCIGDKCQLWDNTYNDCTHKINTAHDKVIMDQTKVIMDQTKVIMDDTAIIKYQTKVIMDDTIVIMNHHDHVHVSHRHPRKHHCIDGLTLDCGCTSTECFSITRVSRLIQEYSSGEDMDRNGLIFGKDFIIDVNDPQCPRSLVALETQETFSVPDPINVKSWIDYLSTVPYNEEGTSHY